MSLKVTRPPGASWQEIYVFVCRVFEVSVYETVNMKNPVLALPVAPTVTVYSLSPEIVYELFSPATSWMLERTS